MTRKSRSTRPASVDDSVPSNPSGERLQKVLAAAGVASRRQCEQLILDGRVEVDRETVTRLGVRVDPARQEIRIDGTALRKPKHVYYLLNKPVGVLCTNRDPAGRQRAIDLVPTDERLFTVGRLDRGSGGLILITNDGELANRLTHPRYQVAKTYRVRVAGQPAPAQLQKLRQGVHLAEGVARVSSLRVKARQAGATDLDMVLTEGRNREVRRVLAQIGHKVTRLKRIGFGPLRLGRLAPGQWRVLTKEEVSHLRRLAAGAEARPTGNKTASRSGTGARQRNRRTTAGAKRSGSPRTTKTGATSRSSRAAAGRRGAARSSGKSTPAPRARRRSR